MYISYSPHCPVQPHFVTTTQHITINATYHNWSHNMSQLTQIVTILRQNVTTQQRNLSPEFRFICNMSQPDIDWDWDILFEPGTFWKVLKSCSYFLIISQDIYRLSDAISMWNFWNKTIGNWEHNDSSWKSRVWQILRLEGGLGLKECQSFEGSGFFLVL